MTGLPLTRILLIEDDPDIQEVARLALEAVGGFTVGVCSRGIDAVAQAREFGPQLILLDVMMPDLDGPATLKLLRAAAHTASTPVVFMTAKVQPRELREYRDLGAADVIAKPFDPMALADTVRTIWERLHV